MLCSTRCIIYQQRIQFVAITVGVVARKEGQCKREMGKMKMKNDDANYGEQCEGQNERTT